MIKFLFTSIFFFFLFSNIHVQAQEADTDSQVAYSIGVNLGQTLKSQGLAHLNANTILKGLEDGLADKNTITKEEAVRIVSNRIQAMKKLNAMANDSMGMHFLNLNGMRPEVNQTKSGLQYQVVKQGNGDKPKSKDYVSVLYTGRFIDGEIYTESIDPNKPAKFYVNQVIKGWTEALQMMSIGSKWRVYVPSYLAYGERGSKGKVEPNQTLLFEIELISINK